MRYCLSEQGLEEPSKKSPKLNTAKSKKPKTTKAPSPAPPSTEHTRPSSAESSNTASSPNADTPMPPAVRKKLLNALDGLRMDQKADVVRILKDDPAYTGHVGLDMDLLADATRWKVWEYIQEARGSPRAKQVGALDCCGRKGSSLFLLGCLRRLAFKEMLVSCHEVAPSYAAS
jgi:hypothetical protein